MQAAPSVSSAPLEPVKMPQFLYKTRGVIGPKYKMVKMALNNITTAEIKIGASSSTTLEWKLPTRPYNLFRSYIAWNENIPAQGAGKYGWTHEDVFDLGNSITFGSAGGIDIVNLQWLQNYSKIARRLNTPLEKFQTNDTMSGLYKTNTAVGLNTIPGGYDHLGPLIPAPNARVVKYIGTDNYIEPRVSQYSSAVDTELNRYRQYPLGALTGTLFGVDRDFYSPVEQYLRIQAGTGDKMSFSSTSIGDPTAGAASSDAGVGITLNNVYLYLAVEQDEEMIRSQEITYASGGMRYSIPYTTAFRNTGGSANSITNIQINLSNQYGKFLKHITHTVWNPQEKFNTAYDCANYDGEKISMYQTILDTIPLQDRILSCKLPDGKFVNSDDWLENKKFMEKRSAYMSKDQYALNWFHRDQFYEPHTEPTALPDAFYDEGLPMVNSRQWQITATIPAGGIDNLVHYTYVEFARDIIITQTGPMFLPNQFNP